MSISIGTCIVKSACIVMIFVHIYSPSFSLIRLGSIPHSDFYKTGTLQTVVFIIFPLFRFRVIGFGFGFGFGFWLYY